MNNTIDRDYSPFDHGTQTREPSDKFYIPSCLSRDGNTHKFYPNGATELSGDSASDFTNELLSDNERFDVKLKSFIDDITERKDEDNIPY